MAVLQTGRKHCGKRRNCWLQAISPFPTVFSKDLRCRDVKTRGLFRKGLSQNYVVKVKHFTKNKILDWTRLREFYIGQLEVPKLTKYMYVFDRVENIMSKGENAGYHHFLLFS